MLKYYNPVYVHSVKIVVKRLDTRNQTLIISPVRPQVRR
jgi:hypothetical protein